MSPTPTLPLLYSREVCQFLLKFQASSTVTWLDCLILGSLDVGIFRSLSSLTPAIYEILQPECKLNIFSFLSKEEDVEVGCEHGSGHFGSVFT